MRKYILFIALLCLVIFIPSCGREDQVTSSNSENSLTNISNNNININKNTLINHSTRGIETCGNNFFPKYYEKNGVFYYNECEGDPADSVDGYHIANLWGNFVPYQSWSLNYLACGKNQFPGIPVLNIGKSSLNNNPYITWDFNFSHQYRVLKKINNGSWVEEEVLTNCWTGENDLNCDANENYQDTDVNLTNLINNYSYKVQNRMFNSLNGESSNVVTYTAPSVQVTISGPTSLSSGQSGTFAANTTGGVPSTFSYTWSVYQECPLREALTEKKDDGMRAPSCGDWRPTGINSATLYKSGMPPGFRLKCTVTDINGSSTDIHYVSVN